MRHTHGGCRCAFTLVELLVCLGVIVVLVSLIVPALRNAREQARVVECLTVLRGLSSEASSWQGSSREKLPNTWDYAQFVIDSNLANVPESENSVLGLSYAQQVSLWHAPFLANGWSLQQHHKRFICPSRKRPSRGELGLSELDSYWYSIALLTSSTLWPAHGAIGLVPESARRTVQLADVRFPSAKSMYFERASWHGNRAHVWQSEASPCNVVFVDGHARALVPRLAVKTISYAEPDIFDLASRPTPLNSTPLGCAGIDVTTR
jgi:prepilin-type N-terminal cleavage/methylation domain-containing protein/prepilin-type processing-associated H-X9-DG protein